MAGIGKYKKGVAFTLKSGNTPIFKKIGNKTPAYLNNFGIGPGASPYRKEDEDKKSQKVPENTTREQGGDAAQPDKWWVKGLKIGTTLLSGGIQGVYGGVREYPKINWGKRNEEIKSESPTGGLVDEILGEDYKLGDLAKKDKKPKYSLTEDYKKPKTNIQGSLTKKYTKPKTNIQG